MRHTASITSMSWIPSEAVKRPTKLPFESGLAHDDVALPIQIFGAGCSLEELGQVDRFQFANHLRHGSMAMATATSPVPGMAAEA